MMWTVQNNKFLQQVQTLVGPYWEKLEDNEMLLWAIGGFVGSIIAASALRYLVQNGARIKEEIRSAWDNIDTASGVERFKKLLSPRSEGQKTLKNSKKSSKPNKDMTVTEELEIEDAADADLGEENVDPDQDQETGAFQQETNFQSYDGTTYCEDGSERLFPRLPLELEEKIRRIQETKLKIELVKTGDYRKSSSEYNEDSINNGSRVRDPESLGDTTEDLTEQVYAMTDSSITPNPTVTPTHLLARSQQISNRSLETGDEDSMGRPYGNELDTYTEEDHLDPQRYNQSSSNVPYSRTINNYKNTFQPIERYQPTQNYNPVYEPQPQQYNQGYQPNFSQGDSRGFPREPRVMINKLPSNRIPPRYNNQDNQNFVPEEIYPSRRGMEPQAAPAPNNLMQSQAGVLEVNFDSTID